MSDNWEALVAAHGRSAPASQGNVPEHSPRAAVLCCSDARVPPSVVFDQPAGSLFVVRVAGNTPSEQALASLDYAVERLGVDLVVVMGHTHCGAVEAALHGACDGDFAAVTAPICVLADQHESIGVDQLVDLNVDASVAAIAAHSGPAGRGARAGDVRIEGVVHDLETHQLREPHSQRDTNSLREPGTTTDRAAASNPTASNPTTANPTLKEDT